VILDVIVIPRVSIEGDFYSIYDPSQMHLAHQSKGFINNKGFAEFWSQLREKRSKLSYTGLAILIMDNHKSHRNVLGASESQIICL